MLYAIYHRYPQAYMHRHKLHVWTALLVKMVDQMAVDATNEIAPKISIPNPLSSNNFKNTMKKVYTRPPHIVADNFFLSDALMEWLGGKGYGMTAFQLI